MKKRLIFLIPLFLLIMSVPRSILAEEVFRITTWEWVPMISKDLENYGPLCLAVKEAFALEGVKVEYGFFPWKRAMEYVIQGEWDGTIIWTPTPERKRLMDYSDPVFVETMNFFHLKSYPFEWKTYDDLKGIRIGATLGYNYGEEFKNAEKSGKINVDWSSGDEINFKKIVGKRIDIFPVELIAGYSFVEKYLKPDDISLITHHPKHLKKDTYHLLFSKEIERNRQMIKLFNRGLNRLRKSGKLQEYLNMLHSGSE